MKRLLFALLMVLPVLAQSPNPTQNSNPTKNAVGMEFVKSHPANS